MLQEGVMNLISSIAQANVAQADSIICAEDARVAERGGQTGASSEISATEFFHNDLTCPAIVYNL
jgi:hypothetical protein